MSWKNVKQEMPFAYKTGDWDGRCSDPVIVQDEKGNTFIAELCEGFLDGSHFRDWYILNHRMESSYEVDGIVIWMEIPD